MKTRQLLVILSTIIPLTFGSSQGNLEEGNVSNSLRSLQRELSVVDDLISIFFIPTCRNEAQGRFVTERPFILWAFIRVFVFGDDWGACDCDGLCTTSQCYSNFELSGNICTCEAYRCDEHARCDITSEPTCVCDNGYEGDGAVCCDTAQGFVFDAATSRCVTAGPDVTPPKLIDFVVENKSINTYTSDDTVAIHIVIHDEGSGFERGRVTATHESLVEQRLLAETIVDDGKVSVEFNETDQTGGTDTDPEFDLNMTFPEGSLPGKYFFDLELEDAAGNIEEMTTEELKSGNFTSEIIGLEDIEAPVLLDLKITPTGVDVTSMAQIVFCNISVEDDLSGFDYAQIEASYQDSTGSNYAYGSCYPPGGEPIAGAPVECEMELVFKQFFRDGNYSLRLYVHDVVGNYRYYYAEELDGLGFPSAIRVESDLADVDPPVLLNLTASPSIIDISLEDQTVQVYVKMQDDTSGFDYAQIEASYQDSTGSNYAYGSCYPPGGEPIAGAPVECETELVFKQFSRDGNYSLRLYVHDGVGNYRYYYAEELDGLGFPSIIRVENGITDIDPPVLLNLTASPLIIDTHSEDQTVQVYVKMQDDTSGFDYAQIEASYQDSTGSNYAYGSCYPPGGEPIAGAPVECEMELVFKQFFRDGNYSLRLYVHDVVGNYRYYYAEELDGLGFPSYITNAFGALG